MGSRAERVRRFGGLGRLLAAALLGASLALIGSNGLSALQTTLAFNDASGVKPATIDISTSPVISPYTGFTLSPLTTSPLISPYTGFTLSSPSGSTGE
jgi:hypothetical protein